MAQSLPQLQFTSFRNIVDGQQCSPLSSFDGEDGKFLGGDSFGNLYSFTNEIEKIHVYKDGAITSCACYDGKLAVCCDHKLNVYSAGNFEDSSLLARRTLPITHCSFDNSGENIFFSSHEPDIVVMDIENTSSFRIATNDIGVRYFALPSSDSLIAYVDKCGSVYVDTLTKEINVSTGKMGYSGKSNVHRIGEVISREIVENCHKGCKISWHPKIPHLLVVPSAGGSCQVAQMLGTEWKESVILSGFDDSNSDVSICCFSPCGEFLALGDCNGKVSVLKLLFGAGSKMETHQVWSCSTASSDGDLVDIHWGREDDGKFSLMILTSTSWARVDNIMSSFTSRIPRSSLTVAATSSSETVLMSSQPSQTIRQSDVDIVGSSSPLRRLKKSSVPASSTDDDDLPPEDDDDAIVMDDTADVSIEAIRRSYASKQQPQTSRDEDAAMNEEIEARLEEMKRMSESVLSASRALQTNQSLHPPIHPSSTKPDEKGRRYLVWNSIGNITSREEQIGRRVEIRFSNTGGRNKQEAFPDNDGFVMASLSYEGAVFATEADTEPEKLGRGLDDRLDKSSPGSTVYYHAFPGSGKLSANETFTTVLNDYEAAVAVTVGCGWVAVATSKGYLRIYSSTGLQLMLVWLKGPVVALVGLESRLAVVYNAATPVGAWHRLATEVFEINAHDSIVRSLLESHLPLSSHSSLEWIGFAADSLDLCTIDSSGMASMLLRTSSSYQWLPVLDISRSKKSIEHKYWPITMKNKKLVHVLLNGENRPAIYPQPVVSTKALRLPITETREGKDKGAAQNERVHQFLLENAFTCHLEADLQDAELKGSAAAAHLSEQLDTQQLATDKVLLGLFQEACRLQRSAPALDLALRLRTEECISSAITVANHFGRSALAARVEDILAARQALQYNINSYDDHAPDEVEMFRPGSGVDENDVEYEVPGGRSDRTIIAGGDTASDRVRGLSARDGNKSNRAVPASGADDSLPPSLDKRSAAPRNPFAQSSSPSKRKSADDFIHDLKGSPSPVKRPQLMRQSSVAQEARAKKHGDKTIL